MAPKGDDVCVCCMAATMGDPSLLSVMNESWSSPSRLGSPFTVNPGMMGWGLDEV